MGEDEVSFAIPSVVGSGVVENHVNEDAFASLLVQKLAKQTSTMTYMLKTLLDMQLHLPENADARDSISQTNIVECLVQIMTKHSNGNYADAVELVANLISGCHSENIKACHRFGAIPLVVQGLKGQKGKNNSYGEREKCARVLELLKIDNPLDGEECLFDFSCITTVVSAMSSTNDPRLQEWGCSTLKYILRGWDKWTPSKVSKPLNAANNHISDDAGQAFLQTGAIDTILNAIRDTIRNQQSPGGIILDASNCIQMLAQKSLSVRSTLIEKGAVEMLGAAMRKWPKDATNVQSPAQMALLVVLGPST